MNYIIISAIVYILGIIAFEIKSAEIFLALVTLFVIILGFKKILPLKMSALLLLIFIFGYFNTSFHTKSPDMLYKMGYQDNVVLEGRIISPLEWSKNKTRIKFYANVDVINHFEKTKSKTIVTINNLDFKFKKLKIGDIVMVQGSLRRPSEARNPSQFDYSRYLKNKNVFSTFYVKDDDYKVLHSPEFSLTQGFSNNWWWGLQQVENVREKIMARHQKYIKSPYLEVLGGIVFGDDAVNPPDEVKQTFINSGLLHLLAASGLNVGIIFFMWFWLAKIIGLGFRASIASSMFFIILYTLMTGFPPSILRASIMLLFVLVGKLIHRETNSLALVFLVGLIMLFVNPKMLMDVGFELSFIVTIGLIVCVSPLVDTIKPYELAFRDKHQDAHPILRQVLHFVSPAYLMGIISVPLIAQMWVAPIQMYYFNTFTPYSLLANIIVIPFVAIISFLGFLSSILSLIPYVCGFILKITDFIILPLCAGLLNISSYFASFPYATINVASPTIFQILIYYTFLFALFQNVKNKFKITKEKLVLLALAIVFALSFVKIPNKNFEITMFDVSNADSFLIKTPSNKYFMIDTGKLPYRGISSFKMIMGEYLKDNGIKELEALILTHFDNDHAGGTLDLLQNFKVKCVYISSDVASNLNSEDILSYLKFKKINFKVAKPNETIFSENDLKITNFKANIKNSDNESSIITLVNYKGKSVLFMGDGGIVAYQKLKNNFSKIDVLKVGHHGALNVIDDKMLKDLSPKYALVSVGQNSYGHPAFDVIDLLLENNIGTFLTKNLGSVRLVFDEKTKNFIPYHFNGKEFEKIINDDNLPHQFQNANDKMFNKYQKGALN